MPSLSRVNSREPGAAVLVVAASARALAQAARRAGYRPLAADFFGDLDTQTVCARTRLIEDGLDKGFTKEALLPALDDLAQADAPIGLVYGAGFEDRPELLGFIARRFPIIGNSADVLRRVKDPVLLAGLCASLDIPHPRISLAKPPDPTGWLAKHIGGAGGSHISPATTLTGPDERIYFQQFAQGEPVSLLFLADGGNTHAIGFSRQWPLPTPDEPFRFGGSSRPARLPKKTASELLRAAQKITARCGLKGLNSVDFLVQGGEWTLIEINPRPGATLDIFDGKGGALFRTHMASCSGHLPIRRFAFSGAATAAIAYTAYDVACMPKIAWPRWAADRQRPKSQVRTGGAVCTVRACARGPGKARALLNKRIKWILDRLDEAQEKTKRNEETLQ